MKTTEPKEENRVTEIIEALKATPICSACEIEGVEYSCESLKVRNLAEELEALLCAVDFGKNNG